LVDAVGISAGESHSLALLAESKLPAPIEVHPGPGSLTLTWSAASASEPWTVSWRAIEHPAAPWGKYIPRAPTTRSYTITGLTPGVAYEAVVRSKALGAKIVTGVAG